MEKVREIYDVDSGQVLRRIVEQARNKSES